MRRWWIAAVAAVGAAAVALAVASANLSRFVDANRARLEAALRAELGRPVTAGDVGLSLRHGPGVRVRNVRIADDPRIGGDVLTVDEVVVTVRLLPALVGRYQVRSVRVHAPVVTVVRDDRGWNLDPPRSPEPPGAGSASTPAPAGSARGPLVLPWPCVVRDGAIRVLDRRVTPARELVVERARGAVSGVARDRPITVDATASIAESPGSRVRLAGSVGPVADLAALGGAPLTAALELRAVDADVLARTAAMLDAAPPRNVLAAGPVSLRLHATGTPDTLAVTAALDATPAELRWRRYFAKPGGLALEADLDGAREGESFVVRAARLRLGEHELAGDGTIGRGQPWTVDLRVAGGPAPLAALAGVVPALRGVDATGTAELRATVRGAVARDRTPTVDGAVVLRDVRLDRGRDARGLRGLDAGSLRLEGRLEETAPRPARDDVRRAGRRGAVAGRVRLDVRDGAFRGVNLVEQTLAAGTGVPGVATLLPRRLRDARPGLFGAPDTPFHELGATIQLEGGRARTRDLVVRSDAYGVTGRGWVERDGRLTLTATFLADAALTADVLSAAGPARLLTNREGLLELPVRIRGRLPDVLVEPGPGLLGRVLERALGGRRRGGEGAPREDAGGAVEDALRRLRDLFGR